MDAARGGTDAQNWLMQLASLPEPATTASGPASGAPPGPHTASVPGLIETVRQGCSDRDWLFFWRVVVDGQSAAEVGAEFGASANAVRLVKMRVLRKLRQALAGPDPSGPP
jgi:hypothetical protein